MKKLLLVLATVSIFIALIFYFLNKTPSGLTRVPNFRYVEPGGVSCQAISPECGECFGEIINKQCYVDKTELDDFELKVMGF